MSDAAAGSSSSYQRLGGGEEASNGAPAMEHSSTEHSLNSNKASKQHGRSKSMARRTLRKLAKPTHDDPSDLSYDDSESESHAADDESSLRSQRRSGGGIDHSEDAALGGKASKQQRAATLGSPLLSQGSSSGGKPSRRSYSAKHKTLGPAYKRAAAARDLLVSEAEQDSDMGDGEDESPSPSSELGGEGSGNMDLSTTTRFQHFMRKVKRRTPYYVPFLHWMPRYDSSKLIGDIVAGLSVGAVIIPQSLVYSNLAHLPPINGLYTAFFPLLVYTLMGTSPHLSVGPDVGTAILTGQTILSFPSIPEGPLDDPKVVEALINATTVLSATVGLVSLLLGLTRLGFLDSILSMPMLEGFVLAVAATLLCQQLPTLLGISHECGQPCAPGELPIGNLFYSLGHLFDARWRTVTISVCAITFLFTFKWLKRRYANSKLLTCVPDVLIAVVLATLLSYIFDWKSLGVVTLGHMEHGFQPPRVPNPDLGSPAGLLTGAFTIAILGFVETQLVNKKYASKHGYMVSANRELVALGSCNFIGAFFGCFVAFGSITRTKVADIAGQRSQFGNLFAASVSFLAIFFLLPYFSYLPKCITSSIIFTVAISLIEVHELLFIIKVHKWGDLILLVSMFLVTFLLGVDIGIFFAFGTCLLLAVKQTTLPGVTMLGRAAANDDFHSLSDVDEEANHVEGILIYKIDGALYFANAEKLKDSIKRAETQGGFHVHPSEEPQPMSITSVVFDLSALTHLDSSALAILLDIVTSYRARNARVCLVKLRQPIRESLERAGIIDIIGAENVFRKLETAVAHIQRENLSNLETTTSISINDDGPMRAAVSSEGVDMLDTTTDESDTTVAAVAHANGTAVSSSQPRKKSMPFDQDSPLLKGVTKLKM